MASLREIGNSSQSQNQDKEVLADKPRMHIAHAFFRSFSNIVCLSDC